MIQAFILDPTTLEVAQRIKVATVEQLTGYPLDTGQAIVTFEEDGDIEDYQPERQEDDTVIFVARFNDPDTLLALAKIDTTATINQKRDLLWNGQCQTPKGPVDCAPKSIANILGAVASIDNNAVLGIPFMGLDWTMADNSVVFHTPMELRVMGATVSAFTAAVQTHAKTLKETVDACTSIEQIEAIDIESDWPE